MDQETNEIMQRLLQKAEKTSQEAQVNTATFQKPSCRSDEEADKIALKMMGRETPIIFKGAILSQFPSIIPNDFCWDVYDCSEPNHRHGLFLTGPRGTGKSHFAAAALRNFLKIDLMKIPKGEDNRRLFCQWITVPDLLLEIRGSFNSADPQNSEKGIVNEFSDWKKVLVLDDLGAEKSTEWSMATLFTIINRRYENIAPTIITSNLSLDELSRHIGDRITSRIVGMCRVIEFKGKDRRITQ